MINVNHLKRLCDRLTGVGARVGVGVGVLLGISMVGCHDLPQESVQRIQQAHRAYRKTAYSQADRLATSVILRHANEPDTAEAYYLRGISRLKLGRRKAGQADLQAALRLCQRPELEVLLGVQLGHLAFQERSYRRAAEFYRPVMDDLPAKIPAHEVWYRYGVSLQRSGDFAAARVALRRVLAAGASQSLANDARRKIAWGHDFFTVQCGAFLRLQAARAAADKMRHRGIDAVVSKRQGAVSPRYVVRAGRYQDYASASRALGNVRLVQPDAFIVP